MASSEYLKNNPNYRAAGDWRYDFRRNRADREPREKALPPGSNLDVLNLINQGYSRDEAEEVAKGLKESGTRTGFGGEGIEPDRVLSPRERLRLGLDKGAGTSTSSGPTGDQRKWAKSFRESQASKGAPPKETAPSGGGMLGAAARAFKSVVGMPSAAAPQKPLNFSRSALVEGAKSSGDFSKIREGFNTQSAAAQTGMRMNERGGINSLDKKNAGDDGMTPYAREKFGPAVEENRARKEFVTDKSTSTSGTTGMVKQDDGARPTQAMDFRRTITSKYGGGTNVSRAPGQQGAGTMTDPTTGKTVPMGKYLAEQSAVQDTKYGPNAGKAGEDYFNPAKIREGIQQRKGRV